MIRSVLSNTSARLLAILGLTLATVLVARTGGPSAVGESTCRGIRRMSRRCAI